MEYKVVRDGSGWGVIWKDIFVNDEPMTKKEAMELANKLNGPSSGHYVDSNPTELYL